MKPIIVTQGNRRIPAIQLNDELAYTDKLVYISKLYEVLCELKNPLDVLGPSKKEKAITPKDLISIGYEIEKHKTVSENYFNTNPNCKRSIFVNDSYVGYTAVTIKEDGGTRTVFNGHIRSLDELKLILDLVL